jgi:GNAT superfamily N-acetyltransferase
MTTTLQIRPATPDDAELIVRFVRELAVYEKAEHEVLATPEHVKRTLFADNPAVFGLVCLHGDQPVGFAVYFFNYSTWQGRHGLYLEDLYVTPEARGLGAGTGLLRRLAQIAVEKDCGRFEWSVLDWNLPSIEFYDRLGALPQKEWIRYRVTGDTLLEMAREPG